MEAKKREARELDRVPSRSTDRRKYFFFFKLKKVLKTRNPDSVCIDTGEQNNFNDRSHSDIDPFKTRKSSVANPLKKSTRGKHIEHEY